MIKSIQNLEFYIASILFRLLKSNMCVSFYFFIFALGVVRSQESRLDPLVQTQQGLIRGRQADDGDYSMFLGIPYGKVDLENPFGPSTPHSKFDGIFNAYDDSAMCPQVDENTNKIAGTLDCLHLHVYVPNKASSKNKLPVLVWIHGGGLRSWDAGRYIHGPKFLVRHDVVMVSINYRLGAYGFMCLDTPEFPGNQGLKDQRLALRWIKDNIAAFGGNENKITLMGESAGGISVGLHLISEHDSLFNQVIMQSGTSLFIMVDKSIVDAPFILSRELGFETDNATEALSFLSRADTNSIVAATLSSSLYFKVCIEKNFKNVESFLNKHPLNVDRPKIKNTPILAGFNNKELLMAYELKPSNQFKGFEIFSDALKRYFVYDDEFMDMVNIVRRFYIGDEDMREALRWKLMEFESDISFNFPVQWTIDNYLEKGATNIYQYLFSYSGGRNFLKNKLNLKEDGAAHADEIGYLFDLSYVRDVPSEEDQRMIDQITTLWTNFVKYGEPTPETSELLPVKWIPVSKNINSFLNLNSTLTLERLPYNQRLTFWKLFFKTNLHRLSLYQQENLIE